MYINIKMNKILRIYLTKEVRDFYSENYKMLPQTVRLEIMSTVYL